jgi:hypothetical protein
MAKRQGSSATTKSVKSAKDFFADLGAAGTSKHVFTGMIKPDEGDPQSLMFARPGDCQNWVKIPIDQIADKERVGTVSCEGHTHPLVRLFMKDPSTSDGETFAALAKLHHTPPRFSRPPLIASHHLSGVPTGLSQPGSSPCYWDTVYGWVCP